MEKFLTLANDGAIALIANDAGPGMNQPGVITLANETRFVTSHFSEPLTNYGAGWMASGEAEALRSLLDFLAPAVPVARRFEFKSHKPGEALLSESDDIRAIGSGFKRVSYGGTTVNEKTHNKGLSMFIDKDDESMTEEMAVSLLQARILRNEVRRAATAVLNIDAAGTDKTWNASASPDVDVLNSMDAAGDDSGLEPNRVLYGRGAWLKRAGAIAGSDKAGAFAAAAAGGPEGLKAFLGAEDVRQTSLRFQSAAGTKSKIVGAYTVAFNAQANISKDDPSNVKRFVSNGTGFQVFRMEFPTGVEISVSMYSNIVVTSTAGAKRLNIS